MSGKITGEKRKLVKEINSILSTQNITPYDLLLALGKQDIVPDDIVSDRRQRVINRGGQESPQEYIKNALEDLRKLSFQKKDYVIKSLEGLSRKKSSFSGYLPQFGDAEMDASQGFGNSIMMGIGAGTNTFIFIVAGLIGASAIGGGVYGYRKYGGKGAILGTVLGAPIPIVLFIIYAKLKS
jgi:hypothetical protein